jgi:hypothetical protein
MSSLGSRAHERGPGAQNPLDSAISPRSCTSSLLSSTVAGRTKSVAPLDEPPCTIPRTGGASLFLG